MTTITIDRATVEQALEALEFANVNHWWGSSTIEKAITDLRAALAEPVQAKFDEVAVEQWKLRMVFYDENGEPLMSRQPEPDEIIAALAEPTLQTCNCRWDGEVQVQQCTLHEAHVDAIHEWAERAKTAEKKLAALAQQAEPVAVAERERIAAQWDGCVTHRLDTFGPVDIGASIRAGELVGPARQTDPQIEDRLARHGIPKP